MKITRSALKRLIKEEMNRINESPLATAGSAAVKAAVSAAAQAVKAGTPPEQAAAEELESTDGDVSSAQAVLSRGEIRDAWRRISRRVADSEAFHWSAIFHVGDTGLVNGVDRVDGDTLVTGTAAAYDLDEAIVRAIESKGNVPEGSYELSFHTTSVDEWKKTDPEGYAQVMDMINQISGIPDSVPQ